MWDWFFIHDQNEKLVIYQCTIGYLVNNSEMNNIYLFKMKKKLQKWLFT